IWATGTIPNEPAKEQRSLLEYQKEQESCLLCDYRLLERARRERVVCVNDEFTAIVPFWATWPFETIVISTDHIASMADMNDRQRAGLADILKCLATRYDNLFETPFPYSMGFHQAPTDGKNHFEWHFHAHFYPPLLRSATVRKFMVGY